MCMEMPSFLPKGWRFVDMAGTGFSWVCFSEIPSGAYMCRLYINVHSWWHSTLPAFDIAKHDAKMIW